MERTKHGRNDKCWCGSGRKYKRCHLNREAQQPLGRQEVLERFSALYETGDCLHPNADRSTCSGKIIKAHTIQRNGGLNRIARNGHVYNLVKDGRFFDQSRWEQSSGPNRVGVRKASTFTGFCARHDHELFSPLEKQPFSGTIEQIALLGYRAICYELYMKERDLAGSDLRREADKARPLILQKVMQEAFSLRNSGVRRAIDELQSLKGQYDRVIFERCSTELDYFVAVFDRSPEIMCSGVVQATHDFQGNRLADLGRLKTPADWLSFSLIETDAGGAVIFSWPAEHRVSRQIIDTLDKLSDESLPHAIVRFTFEFFENTYFSPEWWEVLDPSAQANLKKRQLRDIVDFWGQQDFPRPDECLLDDGEQVVDWSVVSRVTSIGAA